MSAMYTTCKLTSYKNNANVFLICYVAYGDPDDDDSNK